MSLVPTWETAAGIAVAVVVAERALVVAHPSALSSGLINKVILEQSSPQTIIIQECSNFPAASTIVGSTRTQKMRIESDSFVNQCKMWRDSNRPTCARILLLLHRGVRASVSFIPYCTVPLSATPVIFPSTALV